MYSLQNICVKILLQLSSRFAARRYHHNFNFSLVCFLFFVFCVCVRVFFSLDRSFFCTVAKFLFLGIISKSDIFPFGVFIDSLNFSR